MNAHAFCQRQEIPVLSLVPEFRPSSSAGYIIAVLDAVSRLPANCNVKIRATLPDAEYTFRLWASAKGMEIADVETRENGLVWRTLSIYSAATLSCIATLVWAPSEDLDQARDLEDLVLRERDELIDADRRDEERREHERELFESTPRSSRDLADEYGVRS